MAQHGDGAGTSSITFEPLTRDRFALLGQWLAAPHVARWWAHDPSPEAVERDFGPTADGNEPAADFIVLLDGEPVGLIQYCLISDFPDYVEELDGVAHIGPGTATIDYLVGDLERTGNRLGTTMIRAFVQHIWATQPAADEILVPVNVGNVASWRALLAAGFALTGQAELDPDSPGDDRRHQILHIRRPGAPDAAPPT